MKHRGRFSSGDHGSVREGISSCSEGVLRLLLPPHIAVSSNTATGKQRRLEATHCKNRDVSQTAPERPVAEEMLQFYRLGKRNEPLFSL